MITVWDIVEILAEAYLWKIGLVAAVALAGLA